MKSFLRSVRSVVDLRWPSGPSSLVSGHTSGLRLESTQAHFTEALTLSLLTRCQGFVLVPENPSLFAIVLAIDAAGMAYLVLLPGGNVTS
jgi:hypothetical protein